MWSRKVHYSVHVSLPLVPVLRHVSSPRIPVLFLRHAFNLLASTPSSCKWSFYFRYPHLNPVSIFILQCAVNCVCGDRACVLLGNNPWLFTLRLLHVSAPHVSVSKSTTCKEKQLCCDFEYLWGNWFGVVGIVTRLRIGWPGFQISARENIFYSKMFRSALRPTQPSV